MTNAPRLGADSLPPRVPPLPGGGGAPPYRRAAGVAGAVNSAGYDTLNSLLTFWSEAFRAIYPNVAVQVEGKGSSTAPPALAA
ncbi:MAG: hypothetical protein LBJ46_08280 [Planctomycetota bacterium]|jgi:phosphate transport system substrate-binding protein|nr:hypothetical protein [Planctomycetota bacterium]